MDLLTERFKKGPGRVIARGLFSLSKLCSKDDLSVLYG